MTPDPLQTAAAHHAAGRFDEAIAACRVALAEDPTNVRAAHLCGRACLDAGHVPEAVALLEKTAPLLSDFAPAQLDLGLALQAAGRPTDAAAAFRRSLALAPAAPDVWCRLAVVLRRIQDWPAAAEAYAEALKHAPESLEALLGLGNVHLEQQQWENAAAQFRRALALQPAHPDARFGLGLALKGLERWPEAIEAFQITAAARPRHLDTLFNLGIALQAAERWSEAAEVYRRALALAPRSTELLTNLGNTLWGLRDFEASLAVHQEVLRVRPDHPATHNNIGNALLGLLRYDEAAAAFQRALELRNDPSTLCNLGNVHLAQNRLEEALGYYRRSLTLAPDFKQAVFNESLVYLLRGDLKAGLPGYELRWILRQKNRPQQPPSEPWDGTTPLDGKTILVCCEQGLGDTLQFVRYVPLLQQRGARVILRAQKPLISLLACLPGVTLVTAEDETLPPFDHYVLLLSLPLALKTDLASIPSTIPYLHAPDNKVLLWKDRLAGTAHPRVGLVCSGNTVHRNDYNRSIPLSQLKPLARAAAGRLYLVQKEVRSDDEVALALSPEITSLACNIFDFSDTAAILENLDLLITVDTSVAHLAGALGKRVWLLLPFAPDWRWMLDRADSPWYPTIRIFRQPAPDQWAPVIEKVAAELRAFAAPV